MDRDAHIRSDFVSELVSTVEMITGKPTRPTVGSAVDPALDALITTLDGALGAMTSAAYGRATSLLGRHLSCVPNSPLVGSVSPFRAMGFRKDELAHTKAMAWLLDPTQGHGFGSALLGALARAIVCDDPGTKLMATRIFDTNMQLVRVESERQLTRNCRADVFLEGHSSPGLRWAVVVEAKIKASEGKNQLSKLLAAIPHSTKLGVFLSPSGDAGKSGDRELDWARLSYQSWARELIRLLPELKDKPGVAFLRMYITGVLEDVCGMRLAGDFRTVVSMNSPFQLEWLLEGKE